MPIEAKAQIVIKGGPESLKVLQGVKRGTSEVAKEAQKAAKAQEAAAQAATKAAEAAARAQQKAARDTARVQQKATGDVARAADKAAKEAERAAQKQADYWRRAAEKSRNVRIQAEEAATRAAQREAAKQQQIAEQSAAKQAQTRRDALRKAGGLLAAGTAGVLAGGAVASSTARGVAGIKGVRERITSANEFRERLVIATNAAGMNAQQREAVQGQVLAASTGTGKDIGELMSVLETGQAQFNNLQFFADNLKEIATISKAAGADSGELATALGFIQKAFGLTGDEAMEAAYLMKASADKGSVELKNLARDFASTANIYAMNTKQKGLAGVRQYLGVAQAIGTGGFGSKESQAETSTRMERFLTDLNDIEVQKGLSKVGVKAGINPSTGQIDIASVIDQLSRSTEFAKSSVRQDIFKDVRGLQAVEALITARQQVQKGQTGAIDINTISEVKAAAGRESVSSTMASMQTEGFFKMQQEAARAQADTIQNLETYNRDILMVAETSMRLESAFGRLSVWADAIVAAGVGTATVGAFTKVAGAATGGGAAAKALPSLAKAGTALTAGAGTALTAGSVAVGAASAAAIAGTIGAGLAIGGAFGTLINEGSGWASKDDKRISDRLAESLFEAIHGTDNDRLTKNDDTKRLITVMEANTRKLESIDQGLRTVNTKPDQGAPREPR